MERILAVVAAVVLLVVGAVTLTFYAGEESNEAVLTVLTVDGPVSVDRQGEAADASPGTRLVGGDRLSTGDGGSAVLAFGRETRVGVSEGSSVEIRGVDEDGVQIELWGGALRATVRPDSGSLRVSSRGREVLATNAVFRVGADEAGGFAVEAEEGDVALSGVPRAFRVSEGSRIVATPDGEAAIGPIPADMLLGVDWPEATRSDLVALNGTTEAHATVTVQVGDRVESVRADEAGRFSAEVPLVEGANTIAVEAVNLLGERVRVSDVVQRDTTGPRFQVDVQYPR